MARSGLVKWMLIQPPPGFFFGGGGVAPCPMCEMASSCLCVVALAMASGSCSGNGNTSLQTRKRENFSGVAGRTLRRLQS